MRSLEEEVLAERLFSLLERRLMFGEPGGNSNMPPEQLLSFFILLILFSTEIKSIAVLKKEMQLILLQELSGTFWNLA